MKRLDEMDTVWPPMHDSKLSQLFQPPRDILFSGTFEQAKFKAEHSRKWLMVNIQEFSEFTCQMLNRDVFSEENIKSLLKISFIFWQVSSKSRDAQSFKSFYPIEYYPYVGIIDPITGQELFKFPQNCFRISIFHEHLIKFLESHKSFNNHFNSLYPHSNQQNLFFGNDGLRSSLLEDFDNYSLSHSSISSSDDESDVIPISPTTTFEENANHTDLTDHQTNQTTGEDVEQMPSTSTEGIEMTFMIKSINGTNNKIQVNSEMKIKELFQYLQNSVCDVINKELVFHKPSIVINMNDAEYLDRTLSSLQIANRSLILVQDSC